MVVFRSYEYCSEEDTDEYEDVLELQQEINKDITNKVKLDGSPKTAFQDVSSNIVHFNGFTFFLKEDRVIPREVKLNRKTSAINQNRNLLE